MQEIPQKKMGVSILTAFTICAVIVLDTLTASAMIGPSAFTWWILMLIGFVLPYTMVVAELGTTWVAEGGIYDWVKRAFGDGMAARTSFMYWINVGLWMPSVFILFAGSFSALYWPDMGITVQIIMCLLLTWLTIWFCNTSTKISLNIAKWGAWAKVFVILALGVAGVLHAFQYGVANHFTLQSMLPKLSEGSKFLPVIIYSLLGLELVACMGKLIDRPAQTMTKTMQISAILIAALYLFGTLGILVALPQDHISLVSGIIDALKILFSGSLFAKVMLHLLCICTLFSFICNMVTWTSGASRAAAEAALAQDLPKWLAIKSPKYDTPVGANNATGVVSSVVILSYSQFAQGNNDLFWSIFSFSSCIFLLPYLFLFAAWFSLRNKYPDQPRPYRVPGGQFGKYLVLCLGLFFIGQGIILFIFPDLLIGSISMQHSLPIILGLVITLIVQEICVYKTLKVQRDIS
ncbi:APC family permease [Acinetobacter sp. MB5]|uniref:APC family permease n=1 Tax=Acinetobacter sp. MB5 TaxID=2069438 RepID=UPI000DD01A8B|nr:APC family permease [Acinetobacter sp. MB5]